MSHMPRVPRPQLCLVVRRVVGVGVAWGIRKLFVWGRKRRARQRYTGASQPEASRSDSHPWLRHPCRPTAPPSSPPLFDSFCCLNLAALCKALGVPVEVSVQDIQRLGRKAMLRVHPDKGGTKEVRIVQLGLSWLPPCPSTLRLCLLILIDGCSSRPSQAFHRVSEDYQLLAELRAACNVVEQGALLWLRGLWKEIKANVLASSGATQRHQDMLLLEDTYDSFWEASVAAAQHGTSPLTA
jgi:hypothetical protein